MSIPSFSQKAKISKAILYSSYNDVTFYVEDETMEHAYVNILNRLFNDEIKVTRVFPAGGKRGVLDALDLFRAGKIPSIQNKCFFIVDRDLDPFVDIDMKDDDLLIYLQWYCIENYFIEKSAVAATLQWKLNKAPEKAEEVINFDGWFERVKKDLFDLFVAYVLCRKYGLGENVHRAEYKFLEDKGYCVDREKFAQYLTQLKEKFYERGLGNEEAFNEEFIQIAKRIRENTTDVYNELISGKYLFASLEKYCTHICGKKVDKDLLLGSLVEKFPISRLDFIKDRVLKGVEVPSA
ncbi:hypothetical protein S2E19_06032 [Bacillus mycoides]|uniref:DUF4435 domain-containing protein n=1 Tax=Bacillus mycoides TaxID=1405 RepID=A0AAP8KUZ4_BACMY|nr:DUF4435 domain-containing protein [Bacillus mycoides]OSY06767.1 hypothetical protein S2E19_06032 [Bacillus mycoides]PJN57683.1 hypothetical protein BAWEI_54510 [Bacillus mycoides]PJN70473.1 hypothetical protein BACWE_26530 [Bacillus mycoides]